MSSVIVQIMESTITVINPWDTKEKIPWVPEVCLARFPVSVNVSIVTRVAARWSAAGLRPASHEGGREKPLVPRVKKRPPPCKVLKGEKALFIFPRPPSSENNSDHDWSQFLGHFTVLLEIELCLLLPLPTPNSMLILSHRDSHQSVNIDLRGRGVSKNK